MKKDGNSKADVVRKKLEGQANISSADHSTKTDHQNQQHNVKKVSLGPNTKR